MDRQHYLDCLDRGTKLYWRTLGKARGMSLRTGDIEWVMSVPRGGVERVFGIDLPPDRVNQAIDELIGMINRGEAPSGILITPSSKPDNLAQILSTRGFQVDQTGSGMAMDIGTSLNLVQPAENIEVVLVKDAETLGTWASIVNTALFGEELFSLEQFHDLLLLDNTFFYLGLLKGHPASTCMIIADQDIATVEMVSTLREYRRNGLAAAAVTAALRQLLAIGVKTAILRAEEEAVNLYRRLGFVEFYKRVVAEYPREKREPCGCA